MTKLANLIAEMELSGGDHRLINWLKEQTVEDVDFDDFVEELCSVIEELEEVEYELKTIQ